MLRGEQVVLRPIQRADLPRLWELVEDFEVAVLESPGPVVPHSLAQFEARFDQDLGQEHKDHAYFGIEVDGALIGEAGLHHIDHTSTARASSASGSAESTGGRGSGRTGSER
jgi:RimJ/RimL family protein N-acetyltransferase